VREQEKAACATLAENDGGDGGECNLLPRQKNARTWMRALYWNGTGLFDQGTGGSTMSIQNGVGTRKSQVHSFNRTPSASWA
jgi:hypothetical protein